MSRQKQDSPKFGQKPCPKCGAWVTPLLHKTGPYVGRAYNDDGTWHEIKNRTCVPDPAYQEKARLQRAEWEAKNLIKDNERKESRGYTPGYMRRG